MNLLDVMEDFWLLRAGSIGLWCNRFLFVCDWLISRVGLILRRRRNLELGHVILVWFIMLGEERIRL